MKFLGSIHARVVVGALLVLLAFLAGAGLAVERAHADSVLAARFARLQSTVYLLMARAELDDGGALVMPPSLAEPRLSLPASGLYASIYQRGPATRSGSRHPHWAFTRHFRATSRPANGATTTWTERMAPFWPRPMASSGRIGTSPCRWSFRCWRTGRSSRKR